MAAYDHFNKPTSNPFSNPSSRQPNPHLFNYNSHPSDPSQNSSRFDFSFDDNKYDSPNFNLPYHNAHEQGRRPANEPYSESIPMKDATKIKTPSPHRSRRGKPYPPSPETQPERGLSPEVSEKKPGFFSGPVPWVVYFVSLVQITVFVVEIIKNSIITGSPIMIHPQFNPMIGPSTYVLINMGARFVPCMRTTPGVQDSSVPVNWPCPNTTTSDPNYPTNHCDLSALCGFSGLNDDHPNQWFRFITPMFLHAGLIHIGFNLMLQLTMGREMERTIGSIRFALVYFSSGIFGFVLGGNFAATAIASTGASGCLFGILALVLLDLIYCWNERHNPTRELMWILFDILISLVLGLLPGLDNFSHIGGFLMGLAAGICLLHSPNTLRQRTDSPSSAPYSTVGSEPDITRPKSRPKTPAVQPADVAAFAKEPVGFFKSRKPLWWAWWLLRVGALIGVLVGFIVLLNNFYNLRDTCSWCKYLSCLPINNWCSLGNLQLTNTTSSNNKRELLQSGSNLAAHMLENVVLRY